jgi:hypothetical protein
MSSSAAFGRISILNVWVMCLCSIHRGCRFNQTLSGLYFALAGPPSYGPVQARWLRQGWGPWVDTCGRVSFGTMLHSPLR